MSYGSEFQAPRSLWQRNWRCWLAMPSKPVRNRQRRAERAMSDIDGSTLDRLFAVIAARRGADPATSYTAKLLRAGKSAIAKKLGEEAIEAGIEVVKGDHRRLTWTTTAIMSLPAFCAAKFRARKFTKTSTCSPSTTSGRRRRFTLW